MRNLCLTRHPRVIPKPTRGCKLRRRRDPTQPADTTAKSFHGAKQQGAFQCTWRRARTTPLIVLAHLKKENSLVHEAERNAPATNNNNNKDKRSSWKAKQRKQSATRITILVQAISRRGVSVGMFFSLLSAVLNEKTQRQQISSLWSEGFLWIFLFVLNSHNEETFMSVCVLCT